MTRVAVIDYGMGNLRSVAKALEHVAPDARIEVTAVPERIARADRVVFPGQGAIGMVRAQLHDLGLDEVLVDALHRKPFLGICLGLQALMRASEEDGGTAGFGHLAGEVRRFPTPLLEPAGGVRLKVPHMGWNQVRFTRPHPLWEGIASASRFYFVHSYYVTMDPSSGAVAGATRYGLEFTSAASCDNVFAVQFHPEKSQHAGLVLLGNFMRWDGQA